MRRSLLKYLRCMSCQGPLTLSVFREVDQRVESGQLECCIGGHRYPIQNFVPRFVKSELYASSFGEEWNIFSHTQLDSANGTDISHRRFEQLAQMRLSELKGKRVLEVGCGMGRFVEVVAEAGAEVIGVDLSRAVDAAAANLATGTNAHVIQADLFSLPFADETFDYIYSFGVLHHTPSPKSAFQALPRYVRPGGTIGIWVYGHRFPRWLPRPYHVYGFLFKRLPRPTLMRVLKIYGKVGLWVNRKPGLKLLGRALIPVTDLKTRVPGYDGHPLPEVSDELAREWALLNAFDMVTPHYTFRHSVEEVVRWFQEAELADLQVGSVRASVKGRKQA